ncbi:unnamed protein product, partial [Nesidiocoris tenuis]
TLLILGRRSFRSMLTSKNEYQSSNLLVYQYLCPTTSLTQYKFPFTCLSHILLKFQCR